MSITSTVSTLQIYVSTLKLSLRYLFCSYSHVLTKKRLRKILLRKNNLNWRNDNFRNTTVMLQLSFYWLTITM